MNMSKNSSPKKHHNNKIKDADKPAEADLDEHPEVDVDSIDPEEAEISNLISKPQKNKKPDPTSFDEELIERELERESWD
jgi:hypothetical protein